MPRFHFNVHDGETFTDLEGTELDDVTAAKREALACAAKLLADNADKFWDGHGWTVDVTNDAGLLLFTRLFAAIIAPALGGNLADVGSSGRARPIPRQP